MIVIVTPAAIDRGSELKKPWSAARPTGSVIPSRVWSISDGHRKSFHDVTNVKIATAASDGRIIGNRICHQIRQLPGAVHPGRVEQVVGDAAERLAQQEDVECAHEVREDQGRQRVVVVEDVDREDEARDVRQLGRHDERAEERIEDRVAARELHLGERIGGHRGDQDVERADGDAPRSRC